MFPLTGVATMVFLALGTLLLRDTEAESAEVDGFFKQIETPQGVSKKGTEQ
jgi:hypothetical protein